MRYPDGTRTKNVTWEYLQDHQREFVGHGFYTGFKPAAGEYCVIEHWTCESAKRFIKEMER